jgi:hypothetical protein
MDTNHPPSPEEIGEAIVATLRHAMDLIHSAIELHQAACGDSPCVFREGVVAMIAHRLGLKTSQQINTMQTFLDEHNRECPCNVERN